jgi:hypothetical protein
MSQPKDKRYRGYNQKSSVSFSFRYFVILLLHNPAIHVTLNLNRNIYIPVMELTYFE